MPSFMVDSASKLAEFITSLTNADAVTLAAWSVKHGHGYFAVFGPDMYGNLSKISLHVTPELIDGTQWYAVVMGEYHPRKDGKADIEFGRHNIMRGETAESLTRLMLEFEYNAYAIAQYLADAFRSGDAYPIGPITHIRYMRSSDKFTVVLAPEK